MFRKIDFMELASEMLNEGQGVVCNGECFGDGGNWEAMQEDTQIVRDVVWQVLQRTSRDELIRLAKKTGHKPDFYFLHGPEPKRK